jgi:predicted enzyme related to lactoylglutathione lyase
MVCRIYDWSVVVIISLITLVTSSQSMIHSITQVVDGGGMMKRLHPEHQVTNYIDVKSVDEYSSKIQKIGGKVVVPKMAVPRMGYLAICLDTENNTFGI